MVVGGGGVPTVVVVVGAGTVLVVVWGDTTVGGPPGGTGAAVMGEVMTRTAVGVVAPLAEGGRGGGPGRAEGTVVVIVGLVVGAGVVMPGGRSTVGNV